MKNYLTPNYKPFSLIPHSAKGVWVYDKKGKDFLDLTGGIAVNCLGHCHAKILKTLEKQAKKIWHTSNYFLNEPALKLAEKLVSLTFADKVFFSNSGSEANESALKLSRLYAFKNFTKNKNVIHSFKNSFHGRSLFTVTAGGTDSYKTGFAPLPKAIVHTDFNDIKALENAMNEKSCAVILEPIQGEGGIHLLDLQFIKKVRKLCNQYKACLIFDEIQTGIGRTGSFYAYQKWGVEPDILTTAKALGGGFPISAMLCREYLAEVFQPGTHGSTFGGNPLACAVAYEVVNTVSKETFLQKVTKSSEIFFQNLHKIQKKYSPFTSIRGMGLMIGAEFKPDYSVQKFLGIALEQKLLVLSAAGNVLRMLPPLNISKAEIEESFRRLENSMQIFLQGKIYE